MVYIHLYWFGIYIMVMNSDVISFFHLTSQLLLTDEMEY